MPSAGKNFCIRWTFETKKPNCGKELKKTSTGADDESSEAGCTLIATAETKKQSHEKVSGFMPIRFDVKDSRTIVDSDGDRGDAERSVQSNLS